MDYSVLDETEKMIFALRTLYGKYGYMPYRMGKFEEYDLYSSNKDFLISDNVITFTDNGKLMALKPDVTLSIIKNSKDLPDTVQKLYYNENVYRTSKEDSFKEIMQTGLECVGNVDTYCVGEVLWLAAKSLEAIDGNFVLEVSHLGILSKAVDAVSSDDEIRSSLIKCVSEKNLHGIDEICRENSLDEKSCEPLKKLISLYGEPKTVFDGLSEISSVIGAESDVAELKSALDAFNGTDICDKVIVDFSAVGDMNYYNGVIFKGFIGGIPESVLTGGQYDKLMLKMGRKSRAIGFAVYLDRLAAVFNIGNEFDSDVSLIYESGTKPEVIRKTVSQFISEGKSVYVSPSENPKHKSRMKAEIRGGEVIICEADA